MYSSTTWTTALLVAAVFLSCAQAFFLRPLPVLDPLGLLGNTEPAPNKRSVYIHSIKNNFFPGDGDDDAKPGYPKSSYPKPSFPKPIYPKPIYKKPIDLKPLFPKPDYQIPAYPKPEDASPTYPNPSTPKPECTTPKTTAKPSPEQSLIATIRGLIRDILRRDKGSKPVQKPRPPEPKEPVPSQPKTNHYNRIHSHFPLKDGPLRLPYNQGRKNEIYEHENHRRVGHQKLQRANRDSEPQVTEASTTTESTPSNQNETKTAPTRDEPLILQDVIGNLKMYLDLFTGSGVTPSPETEAALEKTVIELFREVLAALKGSQQEVTTSDTTAITDTTATTCTTTTTTEKAPEDIQILMEKALAELNKSLSEARKNLEGLALGQPESATLSPNIESPTGDIGTNIPQIPDPMAILLQELNNLVPKPPADPPKESANGEQIISDPNADSTTTTKLPELLNGVPIVVSRQTRHNYAEDQNEFPKDDEDEDSEVEYNVPPRPSYAIAPRRPQAVRQYERPQSCPGYVEPSRPRPRYQQQRPQQVRPRPQERYLAPVQYKQVQNQYRQNVYRRPVPVPYHIEEEEEEEEEEEGDDGYDQESYGYPENDEQCLEENPVGY